MNDIVERVRSDKPRVLMWGPRSSQGAFRESRLALQTFWTFSCKLMMIKIFPLYVTLFQPGPAASTSSLEFGVFDHPSGDLRCLVL